MNVVRFSKRRKPPQRRRDVITPLLAGLALIAVCSLGWVLIDQFVPQEPGANSSAATQADTGERRVAFTMCGSNRHTCVVDGDTVWLDGVNLRLQSFDTPEPYTQICGGEREVALAKRASARLLDLLNSNPIAVDTFGLDNTGERTLATIRVGGRDVGDILIEEGLARSWPDGDEFWC
jgi:endonuclease YncB( thermonuclease family)